MKGMEMDTIKTEQKGNVTYVYGEYDGKVDTFAKVTDNGNGITVKHYAQQDCFPDVYTSLTYAQAENIYYGVKAMFEGDDE